MAGFSIIEAMIAAAIFSFGVIAVLPLFYYTTEGSQAAARMTQATSLAESKLSELLRAPYDSAILLPGIHNDGNNNLDNEGRPILESPFGAADGKFMRSWIVTEEVVDTETPGGNWKTVRVEVAWWDVRVDRERRITLTGAKANLQ